MIESSRAAKDFVHRRCAYPLERLEATDYSELNAYFVRDIAHRGGVRILVAPDESMFFIPNGVSEEWIVERFRTGARTDEVAIDQYREYNQARWPDSDDAIVLRSTP